MLKLTDSEVASLPGEQNAMIMEFRKMYKDNPSVFKKPRPPQAGKQKEKGKKDNVSDPLKPFKVS